MYTSLQQFKKDIKSKKVSLPFHLFNSIPIHNFVYTMEWEERLDAFQFVFEYQQEEINELLVSYEKVLSASEIPTEFVKECQIYLEKYRQQQSILQKRLKIVQRLKNQFTKNEQYGFKLDEMYQISDWESNYLIDTGQSVKEMECKTVYIMHNSVFEHMYVEFFLGIKDSYPFNDASDIPYIGVKPGYGEYKDIVFYIPLSKII